MEPSPSNPSWGGLSKHRLASGISSGPRSGLSNQDRPPEDPQRVTAFPASKVMAQILTAPASRHAMIRLTITPAAYAVVVATHPASARLKRSSAPNGEFYVWLEPQYVDRLRELRKPRESYSDVILRTAEASEGGE